MIKNHILQRTCAACCFLKHLMMMGFQSCLFHDWSTNYIFYFIWNPLNANFCDQNKIIRATQKALGFETHVTKISFSNFRKLATFEENRKIWEFRSSDEWLMWWVTYWHHWNIGHRWSSLISPIFESRDYTN